MLISFVAAMAVLIAADPTPPTTAPENGELAADAAAKKKADARKIVCREQVRANSRFKTRVCLTKAEWAERERGAEEAARELGNKPTISTARGN